MYNDQRFNLTNNKTKANERISFFTSWMDKNLIIIMVMKVINTLALFHSLF